MPSTGDSSGSSTPGPSTMPSGPGSRSTAGALAEPVSVSQRSGATSAGTGQSAASRPRRVAWSSRTVARHVAQLRMCGRSSSSASAVAVPPTSAASVGAKRSHSPPCLDLGVHLEEPRAALRDAAVHLGVGPAERLADLGVGETLGLEHQRLRLVGLEPAQRLRGALDPLAPGEQVVDRALGLGGSAVEVDLLDRQRLGTAAPDGERLVLDDDLIHAISVAGSSESSRRT